MVFNWREYLELAHKLKTIPSTCHDEVRWRSAISRAYYAAFNIASNYAQASLSREWSLAEEECKEGETHKVVFLTFQKCTNKELKKVGLDLRKLRDLRVSSDYEGEFNPSERDLDKSLIYADDIVQKIDSLNQTTNP